MLARRLPPAHLVARAFSKAVVAVFFQPDVCWFHSVLVYVHTGWKVPNVVVYENKLAAPKGSCGFVEGRDIWYADAIEGRPTTCEVEWVEADHPLFLLYTSGSTGKPKGVVHCTGGYMVYAHTTTKYVFNMNPGDVYWCTADCGWITGHTYLTYGPLLVGATNVVFEGVPTYPGPDRCWQVVDKYAVSLSLSFSGVAAAVNQHTTAAASLCIRRNCAR
jgi:acetyl-CoA synthetase